MRGMKMRIITRFGDRTRSGTFFLIVLPECFQQCYISSVILLPLRFALFLNNASGL